MHSARIFSMCTAVVLLLLVVSTGEVSAQRILVDQDSDQTQQVIGIGSTSGAAIDLTVDASGIYREEVEISVFPNPVIRLMSVLVTGVTTAHYEVSINRQDGSLVRSLIMEIKDGVPGVIDIEKVETGIYTINVDLVSEIISASFIKL